MWQTGATWAEDMATLGSDQSAASGAGMVGRQRRPPAEDAGRKAINPWGLGIGPHIKQWSPSLFKCLGKRMAKDHSSDVVAFVRQLFGPHLRM